jgi:long-subunit fatty acid transport protein
MKKTLLLSTILATTIVAQSFEYPALYKDPSVLSRGGADVAVGGGASALFSNPAGLSYMKKNDYEVNLLKTTFGIGHNSLDFIADLSDATDFEGTDEEQTIEINKVIEHYIGEPVHLSVNNFSSVAYNQGNYSIGGGIVMGSNINYTTHQGFGSSGAVEVNADTYVLGIIGVSLDYLSEEFLNHDRLKLAGAMKVGKRTNVKHNFTTREIVENSEDFDKYIEDEYLKDGTAFGFDLGAIYETGEFKTGIKLNPKVGLSILNIGNLDFGDAGEIPMTVNLGASINPQFDYLSNWVFALDYADVLQNNEDEDFIKRLKIGASTALVNSKNTTITLNTGVYQGNLTAGLDFDLPVLSLGLSTYGEEIGAASGQLTDRRYLLTLALGW